MGKFKTYEWKNENSPSDQPGAKIQNLHPTNEWMQSIYPINHKIFFVLFVTLFSGYHKQY